jgi:hypothetical protein
MARAPFPIADRVSLADVGEHMKQKSDGHEGLALGEVQAALVDGCGVELVWIKEGREVCREYPEPDSFRRQILVWHGVLPRRLHVQLPPEEQKGDTLLTFLCLTDAVRRGLRPASEAPQAEQQSKLQRPPPATQPDKPVIADPALAASARHPIDETKQTPADPASTPATDVGDQAVTAIEAAGAQPRKHRGPAFDPSLVAAVKNRLEKHRPGTGGNDQWERFCDEVRKACKKKATDRGCSDKTIQRIVAALNKQDK